MVQGSGDGLSEAQAAVIHHLHEAVQSRYLPPVYGKDEAFTCQLHLDYRVVRGLKDGKVLDPLNKAAALLLHDQTNRCYQHFLEVSHPTPRQPPIRIPIHLTEKRLRRLGIEGLKTAFKSFVLEIGTSRIEVKGVVERVRPAYTAAQTTANASPVKLADDDFIALAKALNECDTLMGRDFGYANTIALTVLKRERALSADDLRELMVIRHLPRARAKAAMKEWFSSREGRDIEVVTQQCYSGRNFLKAIHGHCQYIDRLSSQIDCLYNKIDALKWILVTTLALNPEEWIPQKGLAFPDAFVKSLHQRFFHLLDKVTHLKAKRRQRYRRIAGLKKSWFGYLSNQEIALAKEHNAAMIREDLTVMAVEKTAPDYKGRRFNKMINNGSKGQYIQRASDKLLWNGIPELAMPTPYTSQACLYHQQLGKRQGERFTCPRCEKSRHSDLNAAMNIAGMLLTQWLGNSEKRSSFGRAISSENLVHEKPLPTA
ncbi:transposase [Halomonas sediminis]